MVGREPAILFFAAPGAELRRGVGKMRRKKKSLDAGTEARRRARKIGLAPSGTKVIPDKRKKPEKHKKDWKVEIEV